MQVVTTFNDSMDCFSPKASQHKSINSQESKFTTYLGGILLMNFDSINVLQSIHVALMWLAGKTLNFIYARDGMYLSGHCWLLKTLCMLVYASSVCSMRTFPVFSLVLCVLYNREMNSKYVCMHHRFLREADWQSHANCQVSCFQEEAGGELVDISCKVFIYWEQQLTQQFGSDSFVKLIDKFGDRSFECGVCVILTMISGNKMAQCAGIWALI